MSKKELYQKAILRTLLPGNALTAAQIAEEVSLSEKSVRTYIDAINDYLTDQELGFIEKKRNVGIQLVSTPVNRTAIDHYINSKATQFMPDSEQRVEDLLLLLLSQRKRKLTTLSLSQTYFVSAPTILKNLKSCDEWLANYDMEIHFTKKNGILLRYEEAHYRMAVRDLLMSSGAQDQFEKRLQLIFPGINLGKVERIIRKVEENWKIHFSDRSFTQLIIFLALSLYRHSNGKLVHTFAEQSLEKYKTFNEFVFTKTLLDELSSEYNVQIPSVEVEFISQIIMGFSLSQPAIEEELDKFQGFHQVEEYEKKLEQFVSELIITMEKVLNKSFQSDMKLYYGLLGHLKPAIFRMKFGVNRTDASIHFIKKEYKDVYRSTWATTPLFEKYFGVEVVDNELLYLSMYFQASLERNSPKLNLLFLSKTDTSQIQFITEKMKNNIPCIRSVTTVPHIELAGTLEGYDLILSTSKELASEKGYLHLPMPFTNTVLESIKTSIENTLRHHDNIVLFEGDCHQLFDPELIFAHCKIDNKEALLSFMVSKMEQKGYVTPKFLKAVLERERVTTTYIENGIAIPHGSTAEVNESKISIAILEEAVEWDNERVDIVFLMALRMNSHQESEKVQRFYKGFINLTASEKNICYLKSLSNNIDLYKYFMS